MSSGLPNETAVLPTIREDEPFEEPNSAESRNFLLSLTEEDYSNISPLDGDEKDARRHKFIKSRNSKQFDTHRYQAKKSGKKWSPKDRKDFMKKSLKQLDHTLLKPHSSVEPNDPVFQLREQLSLLGINMPEKVLSRIEGVVLLCTALSECQSYTQAFSIFMLYLKNHYSEALISRASVAFKILIDDNTISP